MEFCHSYLFVTFVVMTLDQIVGRDDGAFCSTGDSSFLCVICSSNRTQYCFGIVNHYSAMKVNSPLRRRVVTGKIPNQDS